MTNVLRLLALVTLVLPLIACETLRNERDDDGDRERRIARKVQRDTREDVWRIRSRNANGAVLYAVVGDELRRGGAGGDAVFVRVGHQVRRGGADGKRYLHIKGGEVREKDAQGDVVLYFDDREIRRAPAPDSEVLFVWRGTDIWRGSTDGPRALYVDRGTPRWAVACALKGMY